MCVYLLKVKNMPLYAGKQNGRWVATIKYRKVFYSKKKAKRVLRRLNKYHGGSWIMTRQ